MKHVLIIGGNRGLGLAWTKYYLAEGYKVTATYHDRDNSQAIFDIKSKKLNVLECDVTNEMNITALADKVKDADYIIYNAGTKGYKVPFTTPDKITPQEREFAMKVNCYGVDSVMRTFLPIMLTRKNGVFVYMSSGVSSTLDNASGGYHPYRMSKAAGNSAVRNMDIFVTQTWLKNGNLASERPVLFALSPGLVDTGMGAGVGGAMPVKQALEEMDKVIENVGKSKDSHGLWSHNNTKIENYVEPNVLKVPSQPILPAYQESVKKLLHCQSKPSIHSMVLRTRLR